MDACILLPKMEAASDPGPATRFISEEFVEARFDAPAAINWLELLKEDVRGCEVDCYFCSSAELELALLIMARTFDGGCICY